MKKRDSDKNPFEKKNLVKLAPAAVVIAAVAAAGAQAGSSGKEVTAETREVVKSQDLESLLKTAYSYEAADDEAKEESLLKAGKNTSSSSKKKTSKISKKKSGIKKGSSKTLPVKTAASLRGRSRAPPLHQLQKFRKAAIKMELASGQRYWLWGNDYRTGNCIRWENHSC